MARRRMIDPEFWSDEKIGSLGRDARLLFIGMWNFADDEGIIKSRPELLKSNIFPYDDISSQDVSACLEEIKKQFLVFTYQRVGQNYAIIGNFKKHQTINKPTPSKLPHPSIQNKEYQTFIFERDNYTCHICGDYLRDRLVSKDTLENMASVDHLKPQSEDGDDLPSNLATACLHCNKSRGNASLPTDYRSPTTLLPTEVKLSKDNIIDTSVSMEKSLNYLIGLFQEVTPEYEKFFANKTERKVLQELVEKYSYARIENLLKQLPAIVQKPYAPRITSPVTLQKKMADLIIFMQQEARKGGGETVHV